MVIYCCLDLILNMIIIMQALLYYLTPVWMNEMKSLFFVGDVKMELKVTYFGFIFIMFAFIFQ